MVPELDGLRYHEQYSSAPSSSTKWPNFFFLIKLSMLAGHVGLKKYGTQAHQARVPQKVIYHYIFPKQCFWAKYFKNWWYLAILAVFLVVENVLYFLKIILYFFWSLILQTMQVNRKMFSIVYKNKFNRVKNVSCFLKGLKK